MPFSSYIGREPAYGALEKQVITGDNSETTFALNFNVGDPNMLLVVSGAIYIPSTVFLIATNNYTKYSFSYFISEKHIGLFDLVTMLEWQ